VAAGAVYLAGAFTWGLGFVLAPASLALCIIGLLRSPRPRGWLPWIGVAANVVLLIVCVVWVRELFTGGFFS
jgi:hypothetical protein